MKECNEFFFLFLTTTLLDQKPIVQIILISTIVVIVVFDIMDSQDHSFSFRSLALFCLIFNEI
jgi:hypothetical protein